MVGAPRFELGAFGTQNRRATRLRYAPWACQYRNVNHATRRNGSIGAMQAVRGFLKRGMDHLRACGNAKPAGQAAIDFEHGPHIPQ